MGVYDEGVVVYNDKAGVYDKEQEFMRKSGSLCTKAVCRVKFPDLQWCMFFQVSSDYLGHKTLKSSSYATIALLR